MVEGVTTIAHLGNEARVARCTFPEYLTQDFHDALTFWQDSRMENASLPFSGGYMDQPCLWLDIKRAFDECNETMRKK